MRQRSVHWLSAVALAVSFASVEVALAQPAPPPAAGGGATTQPANPTPDGGPPRPDSSPRPDRPRGWGWGPRGEPPSGEEWDAIVAFMSINNPVRLEMLKRIEDGLGGTDRPISREVRRTLGRRYRELESLKTRSPDLYQFALTRLQLEDNILGTMRDLKAPNAKKDELSQKLTQQIRASVDNGLAERQARLDQLAAAVERERKALAKDAGDVDSLVAKQREKFEKEMNAMLDFDAQNGGSPATTQAVEVAR